MKHTILYRLLRSTLWFTLLIPSFARSDASPGPPPVTVYNSPVAVSEWRVVGVLGDVTNGYFGIGGGVVNGTGAADKMCVNTYGDGARMSTDEEWVRDWNVNAPIDAVGDTLAVWVRPTKVAIVEYVDDTTTRQYIALPAHGLWYGRGGDSPVAALRDTNCVHHVTSNGEIEGVYGTGEHTIRVINCDVKLHIACSQLRLTNVK